MKTFLGFLSGTLVGTAIGFFIGVLCSMATISEPGETRDAFTEISRVLFQ